MEGELFKELYHLITEEAQRMPRRGRTQISDASIVLLLMWATLHDRPVCWACKGANWSGLYDWLSLPSASTVSRRRRTLSVQQLLAAVTDRYRAVPLRPGLGRHPLVRIADSKPLVVGGFSKDRNARRGYATGGMARGYKLLSVWGSTVVPEAFQIAPLNLDDAVGLGMLLRHIEGEGYLLADALHDQNPLHGQTRRQGLQLLTPRKKPGRGLGHRSHDPSRLRSIELLEGLNTSFGRALYAMRGSIERDFGGLCSFAGGLQPLPAWVRGPLRVTQWVACKLLINACRICRNKALAA